MKILFISQYFYPEDFKGNDIVFELAKKGHCIDVLTGIPNYPQGKYFDGFGFLKNNDEKIGENIFIYRSKLIPRGNSFLTLVLNYFSFPLFSYFKLNKLKKDYDIIFVQQLSPVLMVLPALWMKKRIQKPIVSWILDLWPESLIATTSIKKGFVVKLLDGFVKKFYKASDVILISSQYFKQSILSKTPEVESRIKYFPNWAEDNIALNDKRIDLSNIEFPNGYNVMFAGNVGDAQDFESILKAAELSINTGVNWLIVGDGRRLNWVKDEIKVRNITNVYLLGRHPLEAMPSFFEKADAMLVSLRDEPIYSMTVPAKIQAYMSCGKVIFGMLNGEGNELINKSNIGIAVEAGDYKQLVSAIEKVKILGLEKITEMENNSLKYYNENFTKLKLINELELILKSKYHDTK